MGRREPDCVLEVLDAEGDAGERPDLLTAGSAIVQSRRLGQCAVGVDRDERVERRVQRVDPLEGVADHLARRHLAGPDTGRQIRHRIDPKVHAGRP